MTEPDELDRAATLTQQMNDAAVSNARSKSKPQQVQNDDGTWPHEDCVDCEEPIPPSRLQLGRIRCVHCQGILERRLR